MNDRHPSPKWPLAALVALVAAGLAVFLVRLQGIERHRGRPEGRAAGAGAPLDRTAAIHGTVTDAATGGPASGAAVRLVAWEGGEEVARATGDAQGRFAFESVPARVPYLVGAREADGSWHFAHITPLPGERARVDLVLGAVSIARADPSPAATRPPRDDAPGPGSPADSRSVDAEVAGYLTRFLAHAIYFRKARESQTGRVDTAPLHAEAVALTRALLDSRAAQQAFVRAFEAATPDDAVFLWDVGYGTFLPDLNGKIVERLPEFQADLHHLLLQEQEDGKRQFLWNLLTQRRPEPQQPR